MKTKHLRKLARKLYAMDTQPFTHGQSWVRTGGVAVETSNVVDTLHELGYVVEAVLGIEIKSLLPHEIEQS